MKILVHILPAFFFLFSQAGYCQEGNSFLTHYSGYMEGADNFIWSIQQGNDHIMYFANTRGVISYDGEQWKLIKTAKTPLALRNDSSTGIIYAGFTNEIGYFRSDHRGHLIYSTIHCPVKIFEEVTEVLLTNEWVFFCNASFIIQVSKENQEYVQTLKGSFHGFFSFLNKLYVVTENSGIQTFQKGSLIDVKHGKIGAGISFGLPLNESQCLLATTENELFIFNGSVLKKYLPECADYLKETTLSSAVLLTKDEVAVSTLDGGCLVFDIPSGKTLSALNYETGLPDNEVYALGKDNHGGLWIAHEYGLSRFDKKIPLRDYTSYPGIEGHILSVLHFQKTLYVATSEGVYFLSRPSYRDPVPHKAQTTEKRSFHNPFHTIFKKKLGLKKKQERTKNNLIHSSAKSRHADSYMFKKISGIHGKCRQLISYKDHILVASSKGLFRIENNKGRSIIKEEHIYLIYPSAVHPGLYLSLENRLVYLTENSNRWIQETLMQSPVTVYSMEEDFNKNLWLGSSGKIMKVTVNNHLQIAGVKMYHLPEAQYENIEVKNIQGEIRFLSSHGIFYYQPSGDTICRDASFNKSEDPVFRYISQQGSYTWITSDSGWVRLGNASRDRNFFSVFSLIKNIQHLYQDKASNIWIVDENNSLFKLNTRYQNPYAPFNVHIREVKNQQGHHLSLQDLQLEHSNNSLRFTLAAPFFTGEDHTHYQYYLEETMEDWSDWTKDHKIEFTFLPSGEYNLVLRARNVFGQITETRTFSFTIYPPYWKTPWFFILEFLFFISLLIVSVILNRSREKDFFTKAITFLTLIITVEFIVFYLESVITVGDADPFIRFGLNVILALLISPIEKTLAIILSKRKRSFARLILYMRKKHWPGFKTPVS